MCFARVRCARAKYNQPSPQSAFRGLYHRRGGGHLNTRWQTVSCSRTILFRDIIQGWWVPGCGKAPLAEGESDVHLL